jgi:hypothetical protein
VLYGAKSLKMTVGAFVRELQAAGVGSLPGTSAEILDDALRDEIAPGRLSSAEWLDVRGCNNHNPRACNDATVAAMRSKMQRMNPVHTPRGTREGLVSTSSGVQARLSIAGRKTVHRRSSAARTTPGFARRQR